MAEETNNFDTGSGSDEDCMMNEAGGGDIISNTLLTISPANQAIIAPTLLAQLKVATRFKGKLIQELAVYLHSLLFNEYLPLLLSLHHVQQQKCFTDLLLIPSNNKTTAAGGAAIKYDARLILEDLLKICPIPNVEEEEVKGSSSEKSSNESYQSIETIVSHLETGAVTQSEVSDRLVQLETQIVACLNTILHQLTNTMISSTLLQNYLYPCVYPILCCKELPERSQHHFDQFVKKFVQFHRQRSARSIQSVTPLPLEPLLSAFSHHHEENSTATITKLTYVAMTASYHFKELDGSGMMLRRIWSYFAPLFVHKGYIPEVVVDGFLSFIPKFDCVRTEAQRAVAIDILDELFEMASTSASTPASVAAANVLPRFIIVLCGGSITNRGSKHRLDRNHSMSLHRANTGKIDLSSYTEKCFTLATRTLGIRSQYVTTAVAGATKTASGPTSKSQTQDWGRAIGRLLTPHVDASPTWAHLRRFARVGETFLGAHSTKNSQQTSVAKFVTNIITEYGFRLGLQTQIAAQIKEGASPLDWNNSNHLLDSLANDTLAKLFTDVAISSNNLNMLVNLAAISPSAARPRMEKLINDVVNEEAAGSNEGLPMMQLAAIACLKQVAKCLSPSPHSTTAERHAVAVSLKTYFPWLRQHIITYSGRLTDTALESLSEIVSFIPVSYFLPLQSCEADFALEVTKATYNRLRDAPTEDSWGLLAFSSTMASLTQPSLRVVADYLLGETQRHESFKASLELYFLSRVDAYIEDSRYVFDRLVPSLHAIAADPHSSIGRISTRTSVLALGLLSARCGDDKILRDAIIEKEAQLIDIITWFGSRYTSTSHRTEAIEFGVRVIRTLTRVVPIVPCLDERLDKQSLRNGNDHAEEEEGGSSIRTFRESNLTSLKVQYSTPSDAHIACANRIFSTMMTRFVYDVSEAAGIEIGEGSNNNKTAQHHQQHVDPSTTTAKPLVHVTGFAAAAIMMRKRRDAHVGASVPLQEDQEDPYTAETLRRHCSVAISQLAPINSWLHIYRSGFSAPIEESIKGLEIKFENQLSVLTGLLRARGGSSSSASLLQCAHNPITHYDAVIEHTLGPITAIPYTAATTDLPPSWPTDVKLTMHIAREMIEEDPSGAHQGLEAVGSLLRRNNKTQWGDDTEFDPRHVNAITKKEPVFSLLQAHIDSIRINNASWGSDLTSFTLAQYIMEDEDNITNSGSGIDESTGTVATTAGKSPDIETITKTQIQWEMASQPHLTKLSTSLLSSAHSSATTTGNKKEEEEIEPSIDTTILAPIMSLLNRWVERMQLPACQDASLVVLATISSLLPRSVMGVLLATAIDKFSKSCPRDFTGDTGAEARKAGAFIHLLLLRVNVHQSHPLSPEEEAAIWRFVGSEFNAQPKVQHAADQVMSGLAVHGQPRPSIVQRANLAALYSLLQREPSSVATIATTSVTSETCEGDKPSLASASPSSLAAKHIRRLVRRTLTTINLTGTAPLVGRDLATLASLLLHVEYGPPLQDSLSKVCDSLFNTVHVGRGSSTLPSLTYKKEKEEKEKDNNTSPPPLEVAFQGKVHASRFEALASLSAASPLSGKFGASTLKYSVSVPQVPSLAQLGLIAPGFAGMFRTPQECTEWMVSLQRRVSVGDFRTSQMPQLARFIASIIQIDLVHHVQAAAATTTPLPTIMMFDCVLEAIKQYFDEWVLLVSSSSRSQVNSSDLPLLVLCWTLLVLHTNHKTEQLIAKECLEGASQDEELQRSDSIFEKLWGKCLSQLHAMLRVHCTNVIIPKDVFSAALDLKSFLGFLSSVTEREADILQPIFEDMVKMIHDDGDNNDKSDEDASSPTTSTAATTTVGLDVRVLQRYLFVVGNVLNMSHAPRPSVATTITHFLTNVIPVPTLASLFSNPGVRHLTEQLACRFKDCAQIANLESVKFSGKGIEETAAAAKKQECNQHYHNSSSAPVTLTVRTYLLTLMTHTRELQINADASGSASDTMKQALLLTAFVSSTLATSRSLLADYLESYVVPWLIDSMNWVPHHNARDAIECFNTISGAARKLVSGYLPKEVVTSVLSYLCTVLLAEATDAATSVAATTASSMLASGDEEVAEEASSSPTPAMTTENEESTVPAVGSGSEVAIVVGGGHQHHHINSKNRLMVLCIESIQALLVFNVHRLGKFSTFEEVFISITSVLGAGGQMAQHNHNNAAKVAIASLVRFSSDEQVSALIQPAVVQLREGKARALTTTPEERSALSTRPERKAVHVISAVLLAYPEQMPKFCAKALLALGPYTHHWHSEARNAAQHTFKHWWKTHRSRWETEFKKTLSADTVERLEEYFAGATYFV